MTEATSPVPPGRARLEAARAAKLELDARVAAAGLTEPAERVRDVVPPAAGTTVHVLVSGVTVHVGEQMLSSGRVLTRGQNVVITDAMIERTRNRLGQLGGIALAADEDEQLRRWGQIRFRVGEAPADLKSWLPGSTEWREAREKARRAAWAQPSDSEQAYALALVEKEFGPAPLTSATLNSAPNPSIREAELQQQRLAARNGA
ncbi:hypothetical protein ACFWZW_03495 [Microbacterium enclense]|uniref:hypothetical protein n=1 Tax=Microbacterium enclense TaxID=993073 RepID=UPI0036DC7A99